MKFMENIYYIDRPERGNALDLKTAQDFLTFVKKAAAKKQSGVILASRNRFFCSGGDLVQYKSLKSKRDGIRVNAEIRKLLGQLRSLPVIVIAAVDGPAYGGGCELALACDFIAISPKATFGLRQTTMGLTPGWGGLKNLLERVGPQKSLEWLATARNISAAEAMRTGLSDFLHPSETLLPFCQDLIQQMNSKVPIGLLKTLIHSKPHLESKVFDSLWLSPIHKEQLREFFD